MDETRSTAGPLRRSDARKPIVDRGTTSPREQREATSTWAPVGVDVDERKETT